MKILQQAVCVGVGLFFAAQLSMAQSANIYFGAGTAMDSSSNAQIDTFGTGMPFTTPSLGGVYLDLGASILFTPHFGGGFDASWKATHGSYAGLLYRSTFYNFDGIYTPISSKRFEPEFHAGLGGMHIGYTYSETDCDQLAGCQTSSETVETSTHFQVHLAAAGRIYVTDHVFVRPSVDVHYVKNLFQFGSNFVPEYSVAVGYSFGRQ